MSKCISCNNCHHIGWSRPKGNILITIILAFFFLVPAIIYEVWRRSGSGTCENCGSNLVKPSSACSSNKPSDVGGLTGLFLVGVVGSIAVVAIFALGDRLINGGYTSATNPKELENQCMMEGLKHYQNLGQYPTLASGEETSTHVLNICKNSKDGRFKAS